MSVAFTAIWANLVAFILVPALRGISGWAKAAMEDGQISKFEWKLLVATIIRVGFIGVSLWVGLNKLGIDLEPIGAAFAAIIMDIGISAVKQMGTKRPVQQTAAFKK